MAALTIFGAVSEVTNFAGVAYEIYSTAAKAMDAAQKEQKGGGNKKVWVMAYMETFINDLGENWERWAKAIFSFIDFAKSIFNSKR